MQPIADSVLLRQFAETQSDEAFAALVTRHINLVYSVALRQTGQPQHAEEITQAVFIILAKKAAGLRHERALMSWLFQTTRLTANNFVRGEMRRRRREQEAYMQSVLDESAPDIWPRIAPLLDTAVASLREKDRRAILLRFYEGRNLREIGEVLGASEDAAEKRVNRALEKLRNHFAKRGVDSAAATIAETISVNSIQAAPLALAKSATAAAMAKGSMAAASITTLVKGTMKTMIWLKMKFAAGAGLAVLLVGGVATIALSSDESTSKDSVFHMRLVVDAASRDSDTMTFSVTNQLNGNVSWETLHVQKKIQLGPSAITTASVSTNALGGRTIDFTLTETGKEKFASLTRENIGRRLAIIVNGQVVSAPVIRSEIFGGRGEISGNFTEAEAKSLAAKLNHPDGK